MASNCLKFSVQQFRQIADEVQSNLVDLGVNKHRLEDALSLLKKDCLEETGITLTTNLNHYLEAELQVQLKGGDPRPGTYLAAITGEPRKTLGQMLSELCDHTLALKPLDEPLDIEPGMPVAAPPAPLFEYDPMLTDNLTR